MNPQIPSKAIAETYSDHLETLDTWGELIEYLDEVIFPTISEWDRLDVGSSETQVIFVFSDSSFLRLHLRPGPDGPEDTSIDMDAFWGYIPPTRH